MVNDKDVFELLRADHAKVSDLFTQIKSTEDPTRKQRLFEQIRQELEVHSTAEEQAIYPKLRAEEVTEDLAEDAEEEHAEIRSCLETLQGLDSEEDNWQTAIASLEKVVKHHVREEESEIFDSMKDCFDEAELQQIKSEFLDAKRDLKEKLAA
jgi:hemerythrin superfamily protein